MNKSLRIRLKGQFVRTHHKDDEKQEAGQTYCDTVSLRTHHKDDGEQEAGHEDYDTVPSRAHHKDDGEQEAGQ